METKKTKQIINDFNNHKKEFTNKELAELLVGVSQELANINSNTGDRKIIVNCIERMSMDVLWYLSDK